MQLLQIPDFDKFQWMLVTYNWEFVYKDQSVDWIIFFDTNLY